MRANAYATERPAPAFVAFRTFPDLNPLEVILSMSEHIHHVTDDTFESEVLQCSSPVLVDYWAEWCGPCKMIAPILDEVAQEYAGRLKVAKLNIDENQATPPKYGIRGIPTLMLFKRRQHGSHQGRRPVQVAADRLY